MSTRSWTLLITLLLAVFIYATRAVLLPFLAGFAVAYLLDPVTDRLETWRLPRALAAGLVLVGFFAGSFTLLLAIWPVLQAQLDAVAVLLPATVQEFRPWLVDVLKNNASWLSGILGEDLESLLPGLAQQAVDGVRGLAARLLSSGLAVFNVMSLVLIAPVVAFYLLRDWDHMLERLDAVLPPALARDIRTQAGEIDRVLSGFVRGQLLVSLAMGLLYMIGFWLVGLNFSLALGAFAGILALIPFVGSIFSALIVLLVALGQWGLSPVYLGLVVLVFVVVQALESAVLSPRLVGDRVGLHPVWLLFAVFAGGEVLGFTGVLIAVPVAASLAVLVRYGLGRYRTHHGLADASDDA